jgi:hypothetical protein
MQVFRHCQALSLQVQILSLCPQPTTLAEHGILRLLRKGRAREVVEESKKVGGWLQAANPALRIRRSLPPPVKALLHAACRFVSEISAWRSSTCGEWGDEFRAGILGPSAETAEMAEAT